MGVAALCSLVDHRGRPAAWRVLALVLAALPATRADALQADQPPPNWKEFRPAEPEGGVNRAGIAARRMLREGQISDEKVFDAYWQHFLSEITWYKSREKLADIRLDLKKQLRGASGAPQQRLVRQIAFPLLRTIARDPDYDLLVRYNALLILGELNQKEPDARGQGAVSLPEALPVLLEFLDPRRPVNDAEDALRIAALVGVENHAERGRIADSRLREATVNRVKVLADQADCPEGRDPEVHAWIVRAARQTLASLQSEGAGAVAAQARTAVSGR
jgi:hypothetical protein